MRGLQFFAFSHVRLINSIMEEHERWVLVVICILGEEALIFAIYLLRVPFQNVTIMCYSLVVY